MGSISLLLEVAKILVSGYPHLQDHIDATKVEHGLADPAPAEKPADHEPEPKADEYTGDAKPAE